MSSSSGTPENNTVKGKTYLSDYFAHDDGTAEWQVFFEHPVGGEQFASKFHANVADRLHAVQLMFPHVNGDVSDQFFNLKVWVGSLDSEPVLYRQLLTPLYPNLVYDTLQGFTTYLLDDFAGNPTPVDIPAGTDFYIGFEQETPTNLGIPLGFDVQNPCECSWVKLESTGDWFQFPSDIPGAIMMRAVMAETKSTSGAQEVENESSAFQVQFYPNPTTGQLNISLATGNFDDFEYAIFNNLGQRVGQGTLLQSLDLSSLSNGIYSVQVVNPKTGEQLAKRIVLAKD
ncbi:MAG: T9SS type A sorting domain-containing protein [Saprospiraceae bacterium]|nr:T9SS type A sorting domain-containing protein [Saprospiraceae bacterium]